MYFSGKQLAAMRWWGVRTDMRFLLLLFGLHMGGDFVLIFGLGLHVCMFA